MFVKVKGLGGAGALREPMDLNSSFPVILTPSMVFATLETFRHMLDFRLSMSCLGLGWHTCGWAIWMATLATNLFWAVGENFGLLQRHKIFGC